MVAGTNNILLFHNGSIGDFLMYLFFAETLHRHNPAVTVRIVVPRNGAFLKEFLDHYPYVSLIEISKWALWRLPQLFMRGRNLIVVIHPTFGRIPLRIKLLGWLLTRRKGSALIGFKDKGPLCSLYSIALSYRTEQPYHETLLDIARMLGVSSHGELRLAMTPDVRSLEVLGLSPGGYAVIHPGSSAPSRSFTPDAVQALAAEIHKRAPNLALVVTGGAADRKLLQQIQNVLPSVHVLLGAPARELSAVLAHARFFMGVDTGTSHLACFLGTPAIVAAHQSTAINWLPWYAPHATVLYRLKHESTTRRDRAYLFAHYDGNIKPFGPIPTEGLVQALKALAC